ncbi:MAG: hypothetical protein ABIN37_12275 [Burkholderiaceae bacterium]
MVDFIEQCGFALLAGIPAKALICKALASVAKGYQQSYPQKPWNAFKVLTDQVLKRYFTSSHQDVPATDARK